MRKRRSFDLSSASNSGPRIPATLALLLLSVVCLATPISALGSIAHRYIALEVIESLKTVDPDLISMINENRNAYEVGAGYPDTGYVPGATYGEVTHWQPFVDAYLSYLNETYPPNHPRRAALAAFLMGVCTHIASDIPSHRIYYPLVGLEDFKNSPTADEAGSRAHHIMDPATDWYVIVKKHLFNHAFYWWVPVGDLVKIYARMGLNVSISELVVSNALYYVATGLDEVLIALPAYLYDSLYRVPWGMANLETSDTPNIQYGAFPGQIDFSALYVHNNWHKFKKMTQPSSAETVYNASVWSIRMLPWTNPQQSLNSGTPGPSFSMVRRFGPINDLITKFHKDGSISHSCKLDENGDVRISKECIHLSNDFYNALDSFKVQLNEAARKDFALP